MAVNKNFVVKNGLEVGTDLILANTTNSRVGIGTSLPTDTLHVNGGIAGTDFVISGIATIPTLNSTTGTITNLSATTISMGSTAVINSARQLQNIASLDATTTATIESAIEAGPNTFANLNIAGVSTFVGLATFGSGIEVQSGVSTFAGLVDINAGGRANTFQVEDLTSGRIVTVGGSGELQDDADLTFDGSTLTAGNLQVAGVTTSTGLIDANGGVSVSGGSGLQVTGAATVSTTLGVTGNTTIGGSAVIAGINTLNSDGANILGIVTATAFHGDISNATGVSTNIVASVGIQSGGNVVGSGITGLNFIGAGNSIVVNGSNSAIVDIQISGGGAGAATSVGGNAPGNPALGQLWYNNTVARTFVYYDEVKLGIGASAYWIDAAPFDVQGQFLEKTGDNMGGALGIATGSLAAPGLFINGSTNTGIAALKTNEFSFVSAGTEKFNVNATGARIVGTTTVTGNINAIDGVFTGNVTVGGTLTKQDVTNVDSVGIITARDKIKLTAAEGQIEATGATGLTLNASHGSAYARIRVAGDERLRITSAGRVGIGTVNPDFRFHSNETAGSSNAGLFETNQTDAFISFQASGTTASSTVRIGAVGNDFQAFVNGGERLRIKSDGNIGIGENNPTYKTEIKVTDTTAYSEAASNSSQNQLRINNAGASGVAGLLFSAEPSSGSAGHAGIRVISPTSGSADIIFTARNASAIEEKLRLKYNGAFGLDGANYGTAGQVIKSGGSGAAVAWGDATVGVSSAGTSIGNATTLNFIGAGNTFALSGSTVDISIAGGGGGGGSGQFNTGLTNEFYGTASGIGSTVFTAPSTSGKKYILTSLFATNVATANTDVNVIGAFDFNGGERSYFAYNIPLPVGMAAELLKQPMVLNPSDKILLRSTDINRNGVDTIVEYYGTYETQESTDLVGVGLGSATLSDTSAKTLYTSSGVPSVLQSIRIANISDSGPKPISVSITHGSNVIRLVENLIVPKYASVELLDNQKRVSSGAIVKVTLDEASTMGVQLSAKKISES